MTSANSFYVYEHWRPDTGMPFYVGKGKGKRALDMTLRNTYHKRIQLKLRSLGLEVEVRKVFTHLDEDVAYMLEVAQISYWKARNVRLANRSAGGEGFAGVTPTAASRQKLSTAAKEYWSDPDNHARHATSLRMSLSRPEVRAQISDTMRTHLADPLYKESWETNLKASHTPEVFARRAATLREVFRTPEMREKFRLSSLKSRTPELKKQISESMKAHWARKRAAANLEENS